MRKVLLLFLVVALSAHAQIKIPKEVSKAKRSVVSVITYKNGLLYGDGSAVLVGDAGDILASSTIFQGADSAVVIGTDGKVHAVQRIAGVNTTLDCLKARVSQSKKLIPLLPSSSPVNVGEELYLMSYGIKNSGTIEAVKVTAVDSVYSCAYYTIDKPKMEQTVALPLVNTNGELVAVMQPSSAGDTISGYAVGVSVLNDLEVTAMNYGKGFFRGMKIRSARPATKNEAVSSLYMQAVIGDSLSYINAINDFIATYPKAYEGYLSFAEFAAVYNRDMDAANTAWDKALTLGEKPGEIFFAKGKVLNTIVQSGDSLSHAMLTFDNALCEIDNAIKSDNQPLYVSYKADMLYGRGDFAGAYACYELVAGSDLASPEIYTKAAQCKMALKEYDAAIVMLDSAVNYYKDYNLRNAAPYMLTRALLKVSAKRFREAVIDYNTYEEIMGNGQNAEFYYMRFQAELNAKMYQQALNDIDRAIYEDDSNVSYYIEKGMLCYRVKYTEEGIRAMLEARELAPDVADVYYLLGHLYQQGGQGEKAKEAFKKALSLGPQDAENQLKIIK